jgi:hypothetical protein
MSQARMATGMDRLPWLTDEPTPPAKRGNRELAGWLIAATLLVSGVSYWMGAHSWREPIAPVEGVRPSTTVSLPQPRAAEPAQPQVVLQSPPEVRQAPQRELPMPSPRLERKPAAAAPAPEPAPAQNDSTPAAPQAAAAPPIVQRVPAPIVDKPLAVWPASQTQGAYGRLVRIGAFGSRLQAKLGWRYMVRAYPAVAHLQAIVVETRNSRGRTFYRFQIGTTSQAHSEVLCQRMEKIGLSCAVVGLPWKPRGVER